MEIEKIKDAFGNPNDLTERVIPIHHETVTLLFLEVLVDGEYVNEFILKRLTLLTKKPTKKLFFETLPSNHVKEVQNFPQAVDLICQGFVLLVSKKATIAIEARASIDRGIGTTEMENVMIGPRDAFNENFNTNLGLIRRRLRSNDLQSKTFFVGQKSQTKLAVLYMKSIAMEEHVQDVVEKISQIKTDGILDITYLKRYLKDKNSIFPTIMATERPDKSAMALLEGKIVLLLDNSPYTLILPSFFIDFFHTPDD